MMQSSVRRARPRDLAAIARLYLEVADEVVAREPSIRHVPEGTGVERRYLPRIEEADRAVLVAVADDAVVGFVDASLLRTLEEATFHAPGTDIHVEELVVTTSHRRHGVATALMHAVETWGRDEGARMIWVDTHVANEAARELYGGIGYRELGVVFLKEL